MADYTYDPGLVQDDASGDPAPNADGVLRATPDGPAVAVYDLLGNALPGLTTNAKGIVNRFSADISVGYMDFGSAPQRVASDQQQEALDAALDAKAAATAAASAATAAAANASQAVAAAQTTATAALTAATWERVPQNPAGTWTPKQSTIPRVFVRTIVGSDRPSNGNIVGSTLMVGDRVEHEVDLP